MTLQPADFILFLQASVTKGTHWVDPPRHSTPLCLVRGQVGWSCSVLTRLYISEPLGFADEYRRFYRHPFRPSSIVAVCQAVSSEHCAPAIVLPGFWYYAQLHKRTLKKERLCIYSAVKDYYFFFALESFGCRVTQRSIRASPWFHSFMAIPVAAYRCRTAKLHHNDIVAFCKASHLKEGVAALLFGPPVRTGD